MESLTILNNSERRQAHCLLNSIETCCYFKINMHISNLLTLCILIFSIINLVFNLINYYYFIVINY